MDVFMVEFLGAIAGVLTTISFVPQVLKIAKTKHVRDISISMYVVLTTGIFFWLIYGLLIRKFPIIFANAVALILCLFIVGMKVRYEGRK